MGNISFPLSEKSEKPSFKTDLDEIVTDPQALRSITDFVIEIFKSLGELFKKVGEALGTAAHTFCLFSGLFGAWNFVGEIGAWLKGERNNPIKVARAAFDTAGAAVDAIEFLRFTSVISLNQGIAATLPFISSSCGIISSTIGIVANSIKIDNQQKNSLLMKNSLDKCKKWQNLLVDQEKALAFYEQKRENEADREKKQKIAQKCDAIRNEGFKALQESKRLKVFELSKNLKVNVIKQGKTIFTLLTDIVSLISYVTAAVLLIAALCGFVLNPWIGLSIALVAAGIGLAKHFVNKFYFDHQIKVAKAL